MRIGVICEGPTDFIAIEAFLGEALIRRKLSPTFLQIQPDPDNTSDGGWTRVFYWLSENSPASRILNYFDGGLFAGNLSGKLCDVLVIQMDSDILDQPSFAATLASKGIAVNVATGPNERGSEIERLLTIFSRQDEMTNADRTRHVIAPAVEASETWCVAAYNKLKVDPEKMSIQELRDAFGCALAASEGRMPSPPYGEIDKAIKRRQHFCRTHAASRYIEGQAYHFRQMVDRVIASCT